MATSKLGSAKRFGARYGRRLKHKFAAVEAILRQKHKCPYCNYKQVKRISAGIWFCKKCDAKFTAKAYTVKQQTAKEEV
jgi:large subunit ribosomal protein L37Ae